MGQNYRSMITIWESMQTLQAHSQVSYAFLVRYYVLEFKGQQKLEASIQHDHAKNIYPLNFYNLQINLTKFRALLLRAVNEARLFWGETSSSNPDQKKLISSIKQIDSLFKAIRLNYKFISALGKDNVGNSEYERHWNEKVKFLVNSIYMPFLNSLCNEKNVCVTRAVEDIGYDDKKPKSLKFYDANASTGICTVSLQNGDKFSHIMTSNKQFWNLVNTPKIEGATPELFLPKEMVVNHRQQMQDFLNSGEYFLKYHPGFIISSTN